MPKDWGYRKKKGTVRIKMDDPEVQKQKRDAYDQGYSAAVEEGVENPYPSNNHLHNAWQDGYEMGSI